MPATRYQTVAMATSVQVSQPPQATGTAATSATNGMITNAHSPIMMPRPCLPSVRGFGPWSGATGVGGLSRAVVMAPRTLVGWVIGYAYVTVTYGTVLWHG